MVFCHVLLCVYIVIFMIMLLVNPGEGIGYILALFVAIFTFGG